MYIYAYMYIYIYICMCDLYMCSLQQSRLSPVHRSSCPAPYSSPASPATVMAKYQSAVRQWSEQARKCLRVAVQPQYQFLVFAVMHVLSAQTPVVDQCLTAVAEATGGFQSVLHKVLTVQACQLLWTGCWTLNSIRKECTKSAITSQVCAARANMDEWRQCLQFGSQWHKTTLQGAYCLWQNASLAVPAPPANQWMRVESGQPMQPSDAQEAGKDITPVKLQQIAVEMTIHQKAGVRKFNMAQSLLTQEVDQMYNQFMTGYTEFATSSQTQKEERLKRMASELDRVDKTWYEANWTSDAHVDDKKSQ